MVVIWYILFVSILRVYDMNATHALLPSLPFNLQVARILRQEIKAGQYPPDTPFPGEDVLAGRFGVSKDVIRVSLRNLAGEGLINRVRGRGTFVREAAVSTRTDFVHLHLFQADYSAARIIAAIQEPLQARGLRLAVQTVECTNLGIEARVLESAASSECRVIVASPAVDGRDRDNRRLYARIMRRGTPLVLIDRQVPGCAADQVYFDYIGSMRRAVTGLLEDGCRNPAFLVSHTNYRVGRQRLEGMRAAYLEQGRPFPEHMVFDLTREMRASGIRAAAGIAVKMLADSGVRPDCWVVGCGQLAWAVFSELKLNRRGVRCLRRLRRIVSLTDRPVGGGSREFRELHLGYYRLYSKLGERLAAVLERRLDNKTGPGEVVLERVACHPMTGDEAETAFETAIL